jgi:hypothetical protein
MDAAYAPLIRQLWGDNAPPALQEAITGELQARVALLMQEEARSHELLRDWRKWVTSMFPTYASKPFADHHVDFWRWVWDIEEGIRPRPFVAIWPRGGGKSSSAEMACVAIGARKVRKYVWYIGTTQDQADKHVENIADMLESSEIAANHRLLSQREIGKYGNSRGWRRSRLRTASGFTVDAIGLDTARRGSRVKDARPDVQIYDDIDEKHDTAKTIEKKIQIITTSLLPAGSNDLAVMMVQNLIHPDSIFAQLADGRAGFLYDREVSGPHPAVRGLTYEERPGGGYVVTGGVPTWEGQGLATVQEQINEWGISAFEAEAQHEVAAPLGGIWDHVIFRHVTHDKVPGIVTGCVWVDPAVTETDNSDSHAIQADGIAADGTIYRFFSWEQVTSPEESIWRAVLKAVELGFVTVGIETDQGGDAWRSVYRYATNSMREISTALVALEQGGLEQDAGKDDKYQQLRALSPEDAARHTAVLAAHDETKVGQVRPYAAGIVYGNIMLPRFKSAKAGAGHGSKVERNARMLTDYERGRVVHVTGTHEALEKALKRFPKAKPFDLVDAAYWGWADLRGVSKGVYI